MVATGQIWRALHSTEDQRHKQDIDALLKAAEEEQLNSSVSPLAAEQAVSAQAPSQTRTTSAPHTGLDWDDDEIFDELLAAVPQGKTATDVHSPFNPVTAEKTSRIVEDMVNVAPAMAAMATAHGVKIAHYRPIWMTWVIC